MKSEPAFEIEYTEPAEAEIARAWEWMTGFGLTAAERWLDALEALLQQEAAHLAVGLRRKPERRASAPDVFSILLQTGGRSSSAWHVQYELRDTDGNGEEDTMRILRIRHARRSG
jgi:plasmid stabilization system protein ParE